MATSEQALRAQRAQEALNRGLAYRSRGQWQQAINALNGCIQDQPRNIEAHFAIATCKANLGSTRDAMRTLETLLEWPEVHDAFRVRLLETLGQVAIQAGDYALAADSLNQAYQLTGIGGSDILNQLARVMCKAGDFQRGLDLYTQAIRSE